jgi:hypothetical protein
MYICIVYKYAQIKFKQTKISACIDLTVTPVASRERLAQDPKYEGALIITTGLTEFLGITFITL